MPNRNTKGRALVGAQTLANGSTGFDGVGAPLSGTSGTGAGFAGPGSKYINVSNGVEYFNEGTLASPYWTPCSMLHPNLIGCHTDFRDGVGDALAATVASYLVPGSGVRIFGAGLDQTDSGVVITQGLGGAVARLTTSAGSDKLVTLAPGGSTAMLKPGTHGPIVVDAELTMVSALTLRRLFIGVLGTIADGLVSPVTGSTVTLTLVQDDVAGIFMDVGLTNGDGLFAPHNKADEAATIATTAAGVDLGIDIAAVATYMRLRVEISASGVMTCFVDKVQKSSIAAASSTTVAVTPVLAIASTSAAVKSMDVKRFSAWGNRV